MGLALTLEWAPFFLAAGLMMALALGLLYIDAQSRANRAFALVLLARAMTMAVAALRAVGDDLATVAYFQRLLPYFIMAVPITLAYFAAVYPRPRTPLGRHRLGRALLLGFAVLVEGLYLLDHALAYTYEPAQGASFASAGRGLRYTDFGPLAFLIGLQFPSFGLVALVFTLDYLRAPPGSRRFSGFLILAGFALNALFDGTLNVLGVLSLLASGEAYPWLPWGWALAGLPALTLAPVAVALALLAREAARSRDATLRRESLRLLAVAPLPVLSAMALGSLGPEATFLFGSVGPLLVGTWRLTMPLLVTYALLRYQLFDIDVKVRAGVKHGAVVGCFVLVFFVASETTEALLENVGGPLIGLGAAGMLTLAGKPLERGAERFAKRVMPGVKPVDALAADERHALYREQVALAAQDGALTEKDRRMLEGLRRRLGLEAEEAARLERGALAERPGQASVPAV